MVPQVETCLTSFILCGRDRSAARTTVGGAFPTRALSIREVGASFHLGPRFRRPPCDPGRWAFPSPVLPLASLWSPSQRAHSLRADSPTPCRSVVCFPGRSIVHRPSMSGDSWSCHVPSAPVHVHGVTVHVRLSRTMSAGMTPPASLLRAHAPVLPPPRAAVVPSTPGRGRLPSAPAGRRTFPTLSLRLLPSVLGPLPRRLLRCPCPFLPSGQRPSPRADRGGAPPCPYSDCRTAPFSRLESLRHVQARRCAHHPGRSSRDGLRRMAAVVSPSAPLVVCSLPTPRIDSPSASGH